MFWLVNVADELELLQLPEIVAEPAGVEVAEQFAPRTLAVHLTPAFGMVRLAEPPEDAHKSQLPFVLFVVQLAEKVILLLVTVHPVRVGGLIVPQIGCPEGEDSASPLVDDEVQVTVAVPSLMVTLVDEAVKEPVGETESANTMWAPSPSTAASAGATR